MNLSLIVAMDEERGIGRDDKVPWHLKADLQRFKSLTMGHHLIVGRKTWESIGRPLPGRKIIIITRNMDYRAENCPDCVVVSSLEAALEVARQAGDQEVFIGGGGEIFAQSLPLADRIYLTTVHTQAGCDVFFPLFDISTWEEIEHYHQRLDESNEYPSSFRFLKRSRP